MMKADSGGIMRNWLVLILAAMTLAGCVNPYEKFYQPVREGAFVIPSTEEPMELPSSGDLKQDVRLMYQEGYGLIGSSGFNAAMADRAGAIAQAKKIGANRFIIEAKYRSTQSGMMPITTPTTSTSYTSGTVRSTGGYYSGLGSSASYSGTTTTYGSETTYIPYSVDRYEQHALYFGPLPREGLGAFMIPPTEETRQQAGTNKGYQILVIRRGSPEFRADMLPGDLIVTIGGRDIVEPRDYWAAVAANYGRETEFVLYRGSARIVKKLRIPERDETW
jgi:hypothetical protein